MTRLHIALLAAFGVTVPACADPYIAERYVMRKDTLTFSAGDAVDSNLAIQIPDPWPRNSQDTNIAFDGEKIRRAVKCYRIRSQDVRGMQVRDLYGAQSGGPGQDCLPPDDTAGPAGPPPGPPPGPGGY
ncbi:MAG: hypothetical protein L0Y50_08435 [Beijerinckiaceae bacterium]|nr:hypothetical protein [Beijerinckiaceae bacterium]MCI0736281.1 hypothetical protein [Beijerinckiaceae bacterium]